MDNTKFSLGIKQIPYNHLMRKARLSKGLTQAKLAEIIKVPINIINHIEGLQRSGTDEQLEDIAAFLGESKDKLFPEWLMELVKKDERKPRTRDIVVDIDVNMLEANRVPLLGSTSSVFEIDSGLIKKDRYESIKEVLMTLSSRERGVLVYRFGFNGMKEHTLKEVGDKFKVTKERIRQIEHKALMKLRHPSRNKKLKEYLYD